ncbi:MAG: hypothetical protein J6Q80_08230, partial [Lentisphaeria bacterium]|nr:hypothetical protein [Lentisphaeria bacterium]
MTYRLKKVLFFTCCAAVAVRLIALYTVSGSALEAYNTLPGLDMETLMRFSNWMSSDPESAPMLVLHRFLLFGSLLIGGGSYNTLLIHALQAVSGVAASCAAAYGAYLLCKKEYIALAAGVFYAVYGPVLLYESVALQESLLVHTLAIALALYLKYIQDTDKNTLWGIASGVVLGLNSAGRPATAFAAIVLAAYPLWLCRKEKISFARVAPMCAVGAVWLAASLFNGYFRHNCSPFFNVMPHLTDIHAGNGGAAAAPDAVSRIAAYGKVLWAAVRNCPLLLGVREIPENLDYYLLSRKYPLFGIGPVWLIPLAVSGIISLLLMKRKNAVPLLLTFAALLLPLAARYPIGRYRLMLIPLFVWFAAAFINELIENRKRRPALAAILVAVLGCSLIDTPFERPNPAAHHTYALACLKSSRRAEAVKEMQNAWESSLYSYAPSGLFLVTEHLANKEFAAAELVIT